ncbi:metallophosphoesterase family protein [Arthrobacter sp. NPDC090010]|uniref:metallophosphoesterase family protein n=1 Tax=Arthrobacter sp. NPDC090010 TaxID=3363942 RepID=UPI0037F98454
MNSTLPTRRTAARLGAATAVALLAATALGLPAQAQDTTPQHDAFSFAVIGDTPYGEQAIQEFPQHVTALNADKSLDFVVHVGDIKNGSTVCSDEYFAQIKTQFDRFTHPLVYTPGDNEWTDCHRTNNGAYNPLERLTKLREVFFSQPGKTLGATMPVKSQASLGLPENVSFSRNRISFAVINVPGSNNSTLPWSGLGKTTPTPEQLAEVKHRTDAVVAELKQSFAQARQRHDRAVVVLQQADMFDPTYAVQWGDISAFKPIVQTLIDESSAFDGETYLFDGDSHVYNADRPLATGSHWLTAYGVTGHADRLQRVTVDGAAKATDYLKVSVAPNGAAGVGQPVLNWKNVPFDK